MRMLAKWSLSANMSAITDARSLSTIFIRIALRWRSGGLMILRKDSENCKIKGGKMLTRLPTRYITSTCLVDKMRKGARVHRIHVACLFLAVNLDARIIARFETLHEA